MALLSTVFKVSRRGQIAGLRIDATIEETHNRLADTTDFELEDGVTISDHVRLTPVTLNMNCFISDSPANYFGIRGLSDITANIQNALLPGRFGDDEVPNAESRSPIDAWSYLNTLWENRELIAVVTSLQVYRNMVLTTLTAPKSASTGRSLEFKATLKEVRIVTVEAIDLPAFILDNPDDAGGVSKGGAGTEMVEPEDTRSLIKKGGDALREAFARVNPGG